MSGYLRDENGRFVKGSNHPPEVLERKRLAMLGENNPNYGKDFSETTRKKMSDAAKVRVWTEEETKRRIDALPKGESNWKWKGGRLNRNGYISLLKPEHPYSDSQGYIFEHRLIMEKIIGRYLKPLELVHHINEIKDDNRPENLMLFADNAEHRRYHKELNRLKTA